jgi:virginiamycin B lyase
MNNKRILLLVSGVFGLLIFAIYTSMLSDQTNPANSQRGNKHSPYLGEYTLPTPESGPIAITVDKKGDVWVAATNITKLVRFNPASKTFWEFKIPKVNFTSIWSMAVDNSNRVWFTSTNDNSIWVFDSSTYLFKQYPIPTPNSFPLQLAIDSDGKIWFTELYGGKLGKINPSTGEIIEYRISGNRSGPAGLFVDAENNIWFTQTYANKIAKLDTRKLTFTEYPPSESIFTPTGIGKDNQGRIWFLEHGGSLFGRFQQSDNSTIRFATSIIGRYPTTLPYWLSIDKSGKIWFNEHSGNRIAMFDPSNEVLVEYELPEGKAIGIANALQFAIAPDGNIWFSEWTENKIGMINTSIPIPFEVDVDQRRILTKPRDEFEIPITISGSSNKEIKLQTSGTFSFTGKLLNATARFSPSKIPNLNSIPIESRLTVKLEETLIAKEYVVTVGASDGNVIYSVMVHVDVQGRN